MATTVTLKPNAIDISGSTSGTTTLQATAVAGTTTLTLPAATDTLVGKATTDTLTNKTLTGAVMNGTVGATTPSTGAFTTLSATGDLSFSTVGSKVNFATTSSATVNYVGGSADGFSLEMVTQRGASQPLKYKQDYGVGHVWSVAGSDNMTLDASNLLVGTTILPASGGTTGFGVNVDATRGQISLRANNTSTTFLAAFYNSNGNVGAITVSGSATSFVTSSDYRLKNSIAPMTGALAKVALLKPCTYKWNADGSDSEGFIAHELQEVAPYAVSGEKDGKDMQGVDYGRLTPLLTAALQEAIAKIELLEARLASLESK